MSAVTEEGGESGIEVLTHPTIANVGPFFDVGGFCTTIGGDRAVFHLTKKKQVSDPAIILDSFVHGYRDGIDTQSLSLDLSDNLLTRFGTQCLAALGQSGARGEIEEHVEALFDEIAIRIRYHKTGPIESGQGSSAQVGASLGVGINHLLGNPLSRLEVAGAALLGEKLACGSAHPDNVVPAIMGGFGIMEADFDEAHILTSSVSYKKVHTPFNLWFGIITPRVHLATEAMRTVLRENPITPEQKESNEKARATVLDALASGDIAAVGSGIDAESWVTPLRLPYIPQGGIVLNEARSMDGIYGGSIAGSGPSLFIVSDTEHHVAEALHHMEALFLEDDTIPFCDTHVTQVNPHGASISRVS